MLHGLLQETSRRTPCINEVLLTAAEHVDLLYRGGTNIQYLDKLQVVNNPASGTRMSNFVAQLRNEISRLAKKESRAEAAFLKKATSQSKGEIGALKRRVSELESSLRALTKALAKPVRPERILESADLRFRVDGFVSLRKRLDLSAAEMAKLIGVSAHSVYHWEAGKSRPRASQLAAIAEVRKLGKKSAAARLAE